MKHQQHLQQQSPHLVGGKPLLPFSITPPKQNGPSEAERKLDALTKELEIEMEKKEESEYFGTSFSLSHSVGRNVSSGIRDSPISGRSLAYAPLLVP